MKNKRKGGATGPKPASIRGIAGLTGFSNTTVSLVLNGRANEFNITKETCDLILAKAKEVNYQPNIHARNLRSGRSDIIGLMVPTLHNRFFGELAETFEALARAEGKLALIHVTRYDRGEEDNAIRFLLSQNAECVFVANPIEPEEINVQFAGRDTRQIFIDATPEGQRSVSTDNFAASYELTREIMASMQRSGEDGPLFFLGGLPEHKVTALRISGFRAALEEAGRSFTDDQVIWAPFDTDRSYEAARRFFEAHTEIGGMFVNSIIAMEGITRYFPEDLPACRAVHYGVFDILPYLCVLTDLYIMGVSQDSRGIMEAAFNLYKSDENTDPRSRIHIPHMMILPKTA